MIKFTEKIADKFGETQSAKPADQLQIVKERQAETQKKVLELEEKRKQAAEEKERIKESVNKKENWKNKNLILKGKRKKMRLERKKKKQ